MASFTESPGGSSRADRRPGTRAVRAGLVLISLANLSTGAWAFFAPRSFYADFPGAGRHWVSLLPPLNEHLTTDVGGFYLAFALLFAWAAVTLARPLLTALLTAYLLASALHLGFHVTHMDGFRRPTRSLRRSGSSCSWFSRSCCWRRRWADAPAGASADGGRSRLSA